MIGVLGIFTECLTNKYIVIMDRYTTDLFYAKIKITGILMNNYGKKFKIGKTGQNLEERFDSIYKKQYSHIFMIYTDADKKLIDNMEKDLIEYYMKYYKGQCANDQIGGGESCDGELSHLYIVIE